MAEQRLFERGISVDCRRGGGESSDAVCERGVTGKELGEAAAVGEASGVD